MKKLKKICMAAISAVLAVTLILSTGISAYAESVKGLWYVGQVDDGLNPCFFGRVSNESISVDDKVYSKGGRCSLKLSIDKDYNYLCTDKKVTLEPCTTYKFSAKVKYSGYKADSSTANIKSGAGLVVWTFNDNKYSGIASTNVSTNKEWTELSCTFTTGAETKDYYLRLINGGYLAKCKGTAWFSDVKLEKTELTKDWNMLVVICKTVDTNVDLRIIRPPLLSLRERAKHITRNL